jgi:hypothetical protein
VILATGEEPDSGFSPQAVPVSAEFREQLGAEHDVAVFAPFAALDVHNHALLVDVADFQVGQFGIPGTGRVKRHEQGALKRRTGGLD